MFNIEQIQRMVWGAFASQVANWPPELKQAMNNFEVRVIRDPDRITVVCKDNVAADPNTEKAKKLLLDMLMCPLPQVIAAFQCKVKVARE